MSDILDKPIVLSLNRAWQVIGHRTVKQALVALNGGSVAGNVANRQMKNTVTTDKVSYLLSATLDGAPWGDGTAGTSMVTGTGTGVLMG